MTPGTRQPANELAGNVADQPMSASTNQWKTAMTKIIEFPASAEKSSHAEQQGIARCIVITLRRHIRQLVEWNRFECDRIKAIKNTVKGLEERGNPFDDDRISRAKDSIYCREVNASRISSSMKKHARLLIEYAPAIDAVLNLRERCDLLNVNVADRAGLTEDDGIVHLIHIHHLEDSAEHRGEDFATGPMHWALTLFFADWLCDTKEGKQVADEHLWGPGGMFEFLPTYTRQADGSFTRNPPPLRLA